MFFFTTSFFFEFPAWVFYFFLRRLAKRNFSGDTLSWSSDALKRSIFHVQNIISLTSFHFFFFFFATNKEKKKKGFGFGNASLIFLSLKKIKITFWEMAPRRWASPVSPTRREGWKVLRNFSNGKKKKKMLMKLGCVIIHVWMMQFTFKTSMNNL